MISSIYKFESWATLSNLATPCTFWVLAYVRRSWASAASKRLQETFGLAKGWLHLWQVDVAQHLCLCNHDHKMAQGCARSGKFTLNFPDEPVLEDAISVSHWAVQNITNGVPGEVVSFPSILGNTHGNFFRIFWKVRVSSNQNIWGISYRATCHWVTSVTSHSLLWCLLTWILYMRHDFVYTTKTTKPWDNILRILLPLGWPQPKLALAPC